MANEYLKRTPTSTGNRLKATWSFWVKRNKLEGTSASTYLFYATSGSGADAVRYNDDDGGDSLRTLFWNGTGNGGFINYDKLRDTSSWQHYLIVYDSTLNTKDNFSNNDQTLERIKIFVNGRRMIETGGNSAQNTGVAANQLLTLWGNAGIVNALFATNTGTNTSALQTMDTFFVDGQALTPDVFGFYKDGNGYISAGSTQATDFRPGQWVPKTPRVIKAQIERNGGFGVNGFYLPMNDSSNFGADFHTTPNSIIKLQEDLPQPKVSITSTAQAGLGYTDVLRADPYAANLVLAIPFVNSGLCTDGTNSGISTGFGDYSHIINTSQTAKDVQLITYNGTTPTIVSYASSSTNYYGSACYIDGNGSAHAGGHIRVVDDNIFDDLNLTTANWTIEGWFNPASRSTGASNLFNFGDAIDYNQIQVILDPSGDIWHLWSYTGSAWNVNDSGTTAQPPLNQWSHIAFEKVGTATTSYITTYVNGVAAKVTAVPQNINYSSNPRLIIGGHYVSGGSGGDTFYYDGLVSDVRMYNVAKYTGGFDVPKPYTPVGIATWRAVPDTTANNFATLNALQSSIPLTDGNLTCTGSGSNQETYSTVGITTGKWYVEARTNVGTYNHFGLRASSTAAYDASYRLIARDDGLVFGDTSEGQIGTLSDNYNQAGDIVAMAIDGDNGQVTYYVNGVNVGGPYSIYQYSSAPTPYKVYNLLNSGNSLTVNFGQNPTFSGTTTAGTFTDSNGKGLFKYEPPSGFLALCEDNLPTPTIKNPGEYFKTVLYTGTGSSRNVVGVGFTPDLVWVKSRTNTEGHIVFDSVRGPEQRLLTMTTSTEATSTGGVMSFDEDGYSTAQYTGTNQSGQNYVAWCWRAGAGTTSTNTDGSIPSVVSVNQDAGFSIVSYTGATGTPSVGHGLNKVPKFIIVKNRDFTSGWFTYHVGFGATKFIRLNSTEVATTNSTIWNDTTPTSSVFYLGGDSGVSSRTTDRYIAYCWAEIEGFSKFGSYVGNGSADGPFVYCGFKPAFVLIKTTSGGSWVIKDSSRSPNNPNSSHIYPNTSAIDNDPYGITDFLSNGFKPRVNAQQVNASGETHIFAAFAESPFTTANAK